MYKHVWIFVHVYTHVDCLFFHIRDMEQTMTNDGKL